MQDTALAEAFDASNEFIRDERSYREYLQREAAIWDYNNDILGSRVEGREEGREEARKKITTSFVQNLLADGEMEYEKIAKLANTSVEEVAKIAAAWKNKR